MGRLLQSELANRELRGVEDEEDEEEDETYTEEKEVTAAEAKGALDEPEEP